MNNKKLAVIGANKPLLPFYMRAKSLGYEIYSFAWPEGAVCKDYADHFYPISFINKEEILSICREEHIQGITSFSLESALPTVIFIAENLGLISNSSSSLKWTMDKYSMRNRLKEYGVMVPDYRIVYKEEELDSLNMKFPLIVKPVDGGGSRGVSKVNNMSEMILAFHRAINCSKLNAIIIEEYIDGKEFSIEYISHNGNHYYLATTDKVTSGSPYFIELEHHQPTTVGESINERIKKITEQSLNALEIYNSPSHTELKLNEAGELYIIEIGARMGGDHISSDLVFLSTGYDFIEGNCKLVTNQFEIPKKYYQKCAEVFFLTPQTKWTIEYIDNRNKNNEVVFIEKQTQLKDPVESNLDRSGCFIWQADYRLKDIVYE